MGRALPGFVFSVAPLMLSVGRSGSLFTKSPK